MTMFDKYTQQGAVLFVGLIMLLIMSLIAITSMQSSTLEVRMASNTKDSLVALQTAEAALRAGERALDSGTLNLTDFDTDGSDGLYDNAEDDKWATFMNWDNTNSREYSDFNKPENVNTRPRYIIQRIAATQVAPNLLVQGYGEGQAGQTVQLFRVTARGTGASDSSEVILQSMYGANW